MKRILLSCSLFWLLSGTSAWAQKTTQTPHPIRPNYTKGGENWEAKTPPDSSRIAYSVFLIGDVGKPIPAKDGGEPSLNFMRKQMLAAGAKSTAIYLGDNIYEYGMPEEGAFDREESERRIVDQLNILRGYAGEKYMIPGNHDWKQGRTGGVEQVNRQQRFVENFMTNDSAAFSYTGDFFIPRDACPGPFEVRLQDNLVFLQVFLKN